MTNVLPGAIRPLRHEDQCPCQYDECSAQATQEYLMNADSFGEEWLPLCDAHLEQVVKDASEDCIATCDWCKAENVVVAPFRDYEEGLSGPVYDVCEACRGKSIDRANEEANRGQEDEVHEMPELSPDEIGQLYDQADEEEPYLEYNDLNIANAFNLNGPVLEKGQLGFIACWPDGLKVTMSLDLQEAVLFWRPVNWLNISFVDPARIENATKRIRAMGYDVFMVEEL